MQVSEYRQMWQNPLPAEIWDNRYENFIMEKTGTEITPQCGGCHCGKCPTVGHSYSFKEEQELILENLVYNKENQCWITRYP